MTASAADDPVPAAPRWGRTVQRADAGDRAVLAYEPRPRSVRDLLTYARRWPGTFLVQGDRRVSFSAFATVVDHHAALLAQRGVRAGDRVVVDAAASPEWVAVVAAAWTVGAVPVLANRWWSTTELHDVLVLMTPKAVVSDRPADEVPIDDGAVLLPMAELRAATDQALDRALDQAVAADGETPAPSRPGAPDVDPGPVEEDGLALVLFTSGSSGAPKGVSLSHRSVVANQHNLLLVSGRLDEEGHIIDDPRPNVSLVTTPLFHIGGISAVLTHLLTGATMALLTGRFDPTEVLEVVERERVTTWGGVPTMTKRVLEHPRIADYDLSSLRSLPLGGAPFPPAILGRARATLGSSSVGMVNTWGLSESGGFLTLAIEHDLVHHPGTVGRPYPTVEVRVAGTSTGSSDGELLVRAPTVMTGYYGLPDDRTVEHGWLHTGDLGRVEDGLVFVTGRSKDIVIRGGENVACSHVEQAIASHPAVAEVAVVGLPHDDLGEEVAAAVVVRPGASVTVEELRDHVRDQLAYFEVPSSWHLRDAPLPVLAAGKVDKGSVRRSLRAGGPTSA